MLVMTRPFPPPWDIEEHNQRCFIVRDNNRQALASVYYEEEPGRRSGAGLLTRDEARRIAANIAKLPGLLQRPPKANHETQRSNRSIREIQEIGDLKVAHRLADDILGRLLQSLGYADVVAEYNKVGKWYDSL